MKEEYLYSYYYYKKFIAFNSVIANWLEETMTTHKF
jgi:hypothetical protein